MFGTPERREEGRYYVPLQTSARVGCKLECDKGGARPDFACQPLFSALQQSILSELARNPILFKHPPTLESLRAITPNWGCIVKDEGNGKGKGVAWNPYTKIAYGGQMDLPCYVDLSLEGVSISRSTISPHFCVVYLCPKAPQIEYEWDVSVASVESVPVDGLEEVDDIEPAAENSSIALRDPATIQKEKREVKERIKAALRDAARAQAEANSMANEFFQTYELSDNESAFSEGMEDEA